MNMTNWHWPQWLTLISLILGVFIAGALHGRDKSDSDGKPYKWNGFVGLISFGINLFVLCAGGFFR